MTGASAAHDVVPERTLTALFGAASGLYVRRAGYERFAEVEVGPASAEVEVEVGTVSRDLRTTVAADPLIQFNGIRARRAAAVRRGVGTSRPAIVGRSAARSKSLPERAA